MRVSILKKYLPPIADFLEYLSAKRVFEDEKSVAFSTPPPFRLTMNNLEIRTHKEWKEFCQNLEVKGGRKSIFRDRTSLTPPLTRIVKFKVPRGGFCRMEKLLKKMGYSSVSDYLRGKIENEMIQREKRAKEEKEVVGYG